MCSSSKFLILVVQLKSNLHVGNTDGWVHPNVNLENPEAGVVIHYELPSTSEIFHIALVEQDVMERW
ncbi:hypothetical protein C5167_027193 [Papaver somniferum]|nr:hypothetical protein C5167_027193 [Papaver somniferum]